MNTTSHSNQTLAFEPALDRSGGAPCPVPTRTEVPEADTWDLTRLYPTPADWEADFAKVKAEAPAMTGFRGRIGESPAILRECMECEKGVDQLLERLHHYASLRVAGDSSDDTGLALDGRLRNFYTDWMAMCAFVTPEIQAISDDDFARWLKDPALAEWSIRLGKVRRYKPHVLSENEERLMALSSHALGANRETFSQLTNVDMRFGNVENERGELEPLSPSSFVGFLERDDRGVRERAFFQFYKEFEEHAYTLAAAFGGSVRADVFHARARRHSSALEAALFPDAVPRSIYDNLVSAVRDHLPVLHEYYELRRRLLGLEDLHHYDCYTPLVKEVPTDYAFDDASRLICESLHHLGNEYTTTLEEGLVRGRWVDRYENKGKRSGAFSSGSYGNPPFILMNFKRNVFSDTYTLAHEAGHSMHTWLSQQNQSYQDHHYPIFLAEVASTFNEELLTHHLLETRQEPMFRALVLNRQIDDIRGTVFRQTMFAEFERDIHAMEEAGEALTLTSIRACYRKLLDAYFGPKFTVDPVLELECLRIPHFYSAFYVYKYATGLSASVALSQRVLNGGKAEIDAYHGFLRSGGSRYPLETLRAAGVDLETPEPVRATLSLFKQRVDELAAILNG